MTILQCIRRANPEKLDLTFTHQRFKKPGFDRITGNFVPYPFSHRIYWKYYTQKRGEKRIKVSGMFTITDEFCKYVALEYFIGSIDELLKFPKP